ncbi:HNH endonuclease [Acidovorax sp. sif0715]|nr:HNH endonuclease [Acidovorax sp. sif0732]MBV7448346.1 HNH endonuclease [Acidovorax sp. sif0715]
MGYDDGQQPDGSWIYIGQGGSGDQSLTNAANAKLGSNERSVLLFTTREPTSKEIAQQGYGKLYTFRGSFNVSGVDFFRPDEGPRKGDLLARFFLVEAEDSRAELGAIEPPINDTSLELAALRPLVARRPTPTTNRMTVLEYRARSAAVHRYALLRAGGTCECCGKAAPFTSASGAPYLEVHHMLRLADDGPDEASNVAAVCPNCHRALHFSTERQTLAQRLSEFVMQREQALTIDLSSENLTSN